ncbi:Crp/Fnr family transcriptional regulator [Maribacter sp. 2307ULW6-5]|uniref:Crp/Fnr family transcriptional regulator n=1 Tax=Maribacter sp. 2307ULW6-5 TaxID=3386275 RepID=UPI0039BCD28D
MDARKSFEKLLPNERVEELMAIGRREGIQKGQYYIRAGETPNKFAYVLKGIFRYVYLSEQGKAFTKGIILEDRFISSYSAMISNKPSYFFIEALEDAELFSIPYVKWRQLLKSDPFWPSFLLGFVERGFGIKEKRERDMLLLDAQSRYREFLEEYPNMEKRIPQTVIASYLGIQPESLSRIRKKQAP